MNESDKPVIFISCGQYTDRERGLGADICKLIQEVRPDLEPYFAQNQSTLEGLSDNILKALHSAAGFICVMHERGEVFHDGKRVATRGSVWIEQEIAIAAFMRQALDRGIEILFYKAPAVSLEGIRSVLHLNPRVEFTDEDEVLAGLRQVLPQMKFEPHDEPNLEPRLHYDRLTARTDRHCYVLLVALENVGGSPVRNYWVEVDFLMRFLLNGGVGMDFNRQRSSATHAHFENAHSPNDVLYPQKEFDVRSIAYVVDDDQYRSGALKDEVTVVVRSGSMKPKRLVKRMKELSNF